MVVIKHVQFLMALPRSQIFAASDPRKDISVITPKGVQRDQADLEGELHPAFQAFLADGKLKYEIPM